MMALLLAALLAAAAPQDFKRDGWKAVQEAIDRGEAARAAVEKAAQDPDKDTAFYAQAALAEIDTLAALKLQPLPRSRAAEGPARDVGAALFKAAGLTVEGLPDTRVALPAGLPFWEAATELARQLDGDFESAGEKHSAWRLSKPRSVQPTFASGRVRARLGTLSLWTFHGLGVPADRTAHLGGTLEGLLDFDAPVLAGSARILEAVDDRGRALQGSTHLGVEEKVRSRWSPFAVSFTLPDGDATKLPRLRLACDFLFRGLEEEVEIADLAKDTKKTFGEVVVTVARAERRDHDFVLGLTFKGPGIAQRFRSQDVALTDARGRRWESGGGGSGGGGDSFQLEYQYTPPDPDAVPTKVTFRLVTRTTTRSVLLEFKDVPLK